MGPLATMYAAMKDKEDRERFPDVKEDAPVDFEDPLLYHKRPWMVRPPEPLLRFRDEDQAGPAPPVTGPLAQMYGGRSG